MELSHQPANSTSAAINTLVGVQTSTFNWQYPVFPMPSPRSKASGSDRVPGSVRSSRPRWTPEKHARILAQIKATRTDLPPSFPRPEVIAAKPPPPSEKYQLADIIGSISGHTRSWYDSLTGHAIEVYHTGKSPDAKRSKFIADLQQSGLTKDEATDIVVVWTAQGIPLNPYTVPRYFNKDLTFSPSDQERSFTSKAAIIDVTSGGKRYILKCYGEISSLMRELLHMRGISCDFPRREVRYLLASHIARQVFGWDITPEASLGYVDGRVCVMTPRIEGSFLEELITKELEVQVLFKGSIKEDSQDLDAWGQRFETSFKKGFIRLTLLAMVIGDNDRHAEQFFISTEGRQIKSITGFDWDLAFGTRIQLQQCALPTGTWRRWGSFAFKFDLDERLRLPPQWPEPIPQDICDEFNKVTDNDLKAIATAFEMSQEEVEAMLSRFHEVKAHLANIRQV